MTDGFTGDAACAIFSATGTGPYNHTYAYDSLGNITTNAGTAYTYGDAAHKHAVTAAFGNSYGYDANGNQTTRTIGGVTYTFTYDYENHLTAVSGGSVTASFVYDADGNRVKGTVNGTTTVYIAGLYEYQGGATTLYYEGNVLRRTGYATDNGVFYVLRDQLQSSSVMINQNGTVNSRNYFYPFGGNRGGAAFSSLTTKRFTGQYHEQGLPGGEGLSYYGARWYDAQLGRFASPDTIVPGAGNPQALNRYSYVLNNPVRLNDPSGHDPCDNGGRCNGLQGARTSIPSSASIVTCAGMGCSPYAPARYPPTGSLVVGAAPYPDNAPLFFAGFQLPFGNSGSKSIFGDGKFYSSLVAKEESHAIVACWFTEACGPRMYFGPYSALTQDIQAKAGVQRVREQWAAQGYPLPFQGGVPIDSRGSNASLGMRLLTGAWAFARENVYLGLSEVSLGSTTPQGAVNPIGGVVGSFNLRIHDAGNGQVLFEAFNITGWSSGARIPGTNQALMRNRLQSDPGPGGNFAQIFYWWEQKP